MLSLSSKFPREERVETWNEPRVYRRYQRVTAPFAAIVTLEDQYPRKMYYTTIIPFDDAGDFWIRLVSIRAEARGQCDLVLDSGIWDNVLPNRPIEVGLRNASLNSVCYTYTGDLSQPPEYVILNRVYTPAFCTSGDLSAVYRNIFSASINTRNLQSKSFYGSAQNQGFRNSVDMTATKQMDVKGIEVELMVPIDWTSIGGEFENPNEGLVDIDLVWELVSQDEKRILTLA